MIGDRRKKRNALEQRLLQCCEQGLSLDLGNDVPTTSTPENTISAAFLRSLVTGGIAALVIHERGISIRGAWIEGVLDLNMAEVKWPLELGHCRIAEIDAEGACFKFLTLRGSLLEGSLSGEGLRCENGVYMTFGFEARGGVSLIGAKIGGHLSLRAATVRSDHGVALDCDFASIAQNLYIDNGFQSHAEITVIDAHIGGSLIASDATLTGSASRSLVCDRSKIDGSVYLDGNFVAHDPISFLGSEIGGEVICPGGTINCPGRRALQFDGATISGDVYLRDNFTVRGEVRFESARLSGDLNCSGGKFDSPGETAFHCDRARIDGSVSFDNGFVANGEVRLVDTQIGGTLYCGKGSFSNPGATCLALSRTKINGAFAFKDVIRADGEVDLVFAECGILADDRESWQQTGGLLLDGFAYRRIGGTPAIVDAPSRIAWLRTQCPDQLGEEFRPQPWEQLIRILREMGHVNAARSIAQEKQRALRQAGRIKGFSRVSHTLYGWLASYGYRPERILRVMVVALLLGWSVFLWGSNPRKMIFSPDHSAFAVRSATVGVSDPKSFDPLLYSLDALLPIDLGYESRFEIIQGPPSTTIVQWIKTLETVLGWICSLLLIGVAGNLLKKD